MCGKISLDVEISRMKKTLEQTVRQHQYDFNHPRVIAVSQQLDGLILQVMKKRHSYK